MLSIIIILNAFCPGWLAKTKSKKGTDAKLSGCDFQPRTHFLRSPEDFPFLLTLHLLSFPEQLWSIFVIF